MNLLSLLYITIYVLIAILTFTSGVIAFGCLKKIVQKSMLKGSDIYLLNDEKEVIKRVKRKIINKCSLKIFISLVAFFVFIIFTIIITLMHI